MTKPPRSPIADPMRLPILNADGPVDVIVQSESYILTFTQKNPTLDGQRRIDAVALVRLAMTKDQVAKLFQSFREQQLV